MINQKMLVRIDLETKEILSQQLLFDDEGTNHTIIEELPVIQSKEGYEGYYVVNEDLTVTVSYREIPKTEVELMQEQLQVQEQTIADLMLMMAGGGM